MRIINFIYPISILQPKNDYNWVIIGNHGFSTLDIILKDNINKEFWPFTLHFASDPMTIDYYPYRRFMFDTTNTNFSLTMKNYVYEW